jgi:hypothetical protein
LDLLYPRFDVVSLSKHFLESYFSRFTRLLVNHFLLNLLFVLFYLRSFPHRLLD